MIHLVFFEGTNQGFGHLDPKGAFLPSSDDMKTEGAVPTLGVRHRRGDLRFNFGVCVKAIAEPAHEEAPIDAAGMGASS